MNLQNFAQVYVPSQEWLPALQEGTHFISEATRAIHSRAKGNPMVGALIPSSELTEKLASLPSDPAQAAAAIQSSSCLSSLHPALNALQLTSSFGALASVASLGVSCVGFALVLRRLSRIEAKVDELLANVEELRSIMLAVRDHQEAFSLARLRAAAASLDRALVAESATSRVDLARRARDLFLEAREHHIALWEKSNPWTHAELPLNAALELHGRGVAAAIGEIQSEFVIGDMGAFTHAVALCAERSRQVFAIDPVEVLRIRSDKACNPSPILAAHFLSSLPQLQRDLRTAHEVVQVSADQIETFKQDAELPNLLNREPVEVMRLYRDAPKRADLFLVRARAA